MSTAPVPVSLAVGSVNVDVVVSVLEGKVDDDVSEKDGRVNVSVTDIVRTGNVRVSVAEGSETLLVAEIVTLGKVDERLYVAGRDVWILV